MASISKDIPLKELSQQLGSPCMVAVLAGSSAPRLPATQTWVALSPDSISSARLEAGQVVLVGLCHDNAQALASPSARQPGSATPTPGSATPPSLDSQSTVVKNIWQLCRSSTTVMPTGCTKVASQDPAQGPHPVGEYVVAARIWPCSKLPKGIIAISPAVSEPFGSCPLGSFVIIFGYPASLPPTPPGTKLMPGQQICSPPCTALSLALCGFTSVVVPAKPSEGAIRGATPGPGPRGATPSPDARSKTKGDVRSLGGSSVGSATTASQTLSLAEWSLMQMRSGLATNTTPAPATTSTSSSTTTITSATTTTTTTTTTSAATTATSTATTSNAAKGVSIRVLPEQSRRLVSQMAVQHLSGRFLLPGNPVVLPVMGYSWLCQVGELEATRDTQCPPNATLAPAVSPNSTLTLIFPGEERACSAGVGGPRAAGAKLSQQGGGWAGQSRSVLVEAAKKAASEAVEGSGQDAAVAGAERAVLAGHSSSSISTALGGLGSLAGSLREMVTLPLVLPELFKSYGIRPPRGVLLWGPPGSGKTVLARAAAADAGAVLLLVSGPDVVSEFYGESEAAMKGIFAAARALSPAVIFIDEIDAIAPSRQSTGSSGGMSDRLVTALLTLMDGADNVMQTGVIVLAATNRPDALDAALRRPGRFERELEVGVPSPAARADILKARLRSVQHTLLDSEIESLANGAHGFVGADLCALVDEAAMHALRSAVASGTPYEELNVSMDDFRMAETLVRPSALREVAVEVPSVRWSDVGGLESVKSRLQEAVEWPFKMPSALKRVGATPPRGVLLYGPPGCSKTLLAKAVANEAKLNFISIKGGELFGKFVGESEKAVASLFARARGSAPAVIFFDEIDGLAAVRSQGGEAEGVSVGDRVLSQLLTEMDGLQGRGGVVVVAATNRPDCIDPALLRPGRFDRLLFVPPPDVGARREIFNVHLRRTPLAPDVDVDSLASMCEGRTGADIAGICREAALAALEDDMGALEVSSKHFCTAIERTAASTPPSGDMMQMYLQFQSAGQLP